MTNTAKLPFLDYHIDPLDWNQTLDAVDQIIKGRTPVQHCVLNANKVYLAHRYKDLSRIIKECDMVQVDGISVVWAARFLGLPSVHRITGIGLMERLLHKANEKSYRVFFLGASVDVLNKLETVIRQKYPRLLIAGLQDGYFPESQNHSVVETIRNSKADILFVAISSPKKEFWLAKNMSSLNVPFCMGVGGSFDVMAGKSKRAPEWIQKIGLEWMYRWVQEPFRLAHRYIVGNAVFLYLVLKHRLSQGKVSSVSL